MAYKLLWKFVKWLIGFKFLSAKPGYTGMIDDSNNAFSHADSWFGSV